MISREQTRAAAAGLFMAMTMASAPARAQKPHGKTPAGLPKVPPLAQALHGEAKEAYASAELLFDNGDLAGAERKYQQAYELSKDPRLLFNMAVAEKGLHAYARMQGHLERYVREAGSNLSADDAEIVRKALAAIRNLVGTVTVNVNVPGATVFVDGVAVGQAPLDTDLTVDLGAHTVRAESADFDPMAKEVTIDGGAKATLDFALERTTHAGQLVVMTEPSGTTVAIDQAAVYKDRFDGSLPAGTHHVSVTAAGWVTYTANVDLREHETRTLQVTLVRESHGAAWPWIAGGVAVVAGAAVGGYFLLKPHDTTTPVPPGSIAGIQLTAWGR